MVMLIERNRGPWMNSIVRQRKFVISSPFPTISVRGCKGRTRKSCSSIEEGSSGKYFARSWLFDMYNDSGCHESN